MEENKTLNEKYRVSETKQTAGEWLKKRMSWIVVIGASILFVFKEGLDFSRTGEDVITIILSMALTYIFTLYISIALRNIGKKSGKDSSGFMNALIYLATAKKDIKHIMYLLPVFCRHKNKTTLQEVQGLVLEENGLTYEKWIKGYYLLPQIKNNLSEKEKQILDTIHEIQITQISSGELLSEHSKSNKNHPDPLYLGRDEKTDNKQVGVKMMISKSVFPIISGYFAVQFALGQNWIWGAIQVSIILLIGVTHYMEGEDYVSNELRNRILNKADLLIEFKNLYDNKQEIFSEAEQSVLELEAEIEAMKKEPAKAYKNMQTLEAV